MQKVKYQKQCEGAGESWTITDVVLNRASSIDTSELAKGF
jgi:hypothetical protein